ncbi:MAG TPA: vanadium-dependent haloperoxidase [Longimicrobium sp.]|nr:vanadium-dependent haloperoxidase [Longimicrobium sp.]
MAKTHTLVEDFNDNTADTVKWWVFGDAREVNRRLECWLASSSASTYAGYTAKATYDLTGSMIWIELVRAPRTGQAQLRAYLSVGNELSIGCVDGLLRCEQQVGGAYTVFVALPYDPRVHRWLRIRELNGTIHWETSPDGCAWATHYSNPAPFPVTAVSPGVLTGTYSAVPAPGVAIFDNLNVAETSRARRVDERRLAARAIRDEAAALASERRHDEHANNNDEVNYPERRFAGNYSKSLKHDALGDPDPGSYATLLRALQSEDPADFEEIDLATGTPIKLTSPQAGLAFDIEGPDAQALTLPPAPRFDSEVAAHEMGELYWMAVARDVLFSSYGSDPSVAVAVTSLNNEFPRFGGTVPVTAQNVFRGIYPGEQVGPYVSQFLLKGNTDVRKPNGLGLDANEGFISYGARVIDQRLIPAVAGMDYLMDFPSWLDVQNGMDKRGMDTFETTRRFIRTLRDGATFVHFDQVVDAFYNAAWILMSEPAGNQLIQQPGITLRPQIDAEFAADQGNPYNPPGTLGDSRTQAGFATFGPIHLLQALSEVLGRALRATWWQKWGVHRRLRPEEYGGRVHNQLLHTASGGAQGRTYPVHTSITASLQSGGLAPFYGQTGERFPASYLLPQAYPEGAPTHPAYGAGHATGSGACATILKAFFDETAAIKNPLQSRADGLALVSYTGPDATQMTVGGELNKLAGNIAIFRNAAGVHWRSDYTESLPLGEAIAIGLLQEMSLGFNEDDAYFELTRFDGQRIRIFDGKVILVV